MRSKGFLKALAYAAKVTLLLSLFIVEGSFLLNYKPSPHFKRFISRKVYSLSGFRFADYRVSMTGITLCRVRSSWFRAELVKFSFSPFTLIASYFLRKPLKINSVYIRDGRVYKLPSGGASTGIKISSFIFVADRIRYSNLVIRKIKFFYPDGSLFVDGIYLTGRNGKIHIYFKASSITSARNRLRKFNADLDFGENSLPGRVKGWGRFHLEKGFIEHARFESSKGIFSLDVSSLSFGRASRGKVVLIVYPFNLPGSAFRNFAGRLTLGGTLSVSPLTFSGRADLTELSYPGITFPPSARVSLNSNRLSVFLPGMKFSSVSFSSISLSVDVTSLKGKLSVKGVLPGGLSFSTGVPMLLSFSPFAITGGITAGGSPFSVSIKKSSWNVTSEEVRGEDISKVFAYFFKGFSMTGRGKLSMGGVSFPAGSLRVSFRAGEFSNFPVTRVLSDYLKTLSLDPFVYNYLELNAVVGGLRVPVQASVFGWEAAVAVDGFVGKETIDFTGLLALSRGLREELPLPVQAILSLQRGNIYFLPFRVKGKSSHPDLKIGRLEWVNASPAFKYGDISDYLQKFMSKVNFSEE